MSKRSGFVVQRLIYVLLLVGLSLYFISPFIVPIVLGATVALVLFPFQLRLEHFNWKRSRAAAILTTTFTILISIPFIFFLTKGTFLFIDLLEKFAVGEKIENQGMQEVLSVLRHDMIDKFRHYLARYPSANFLTEEKIISYLKSSSNYILNFFQTIASRTPSIILFLLVMILFTFSFLNGAGAIRKFFQKFFGFSDQRMDLIVGLFLRNARQVYISNIVTGSVQSTIVATSVYFVTNADWFLVFFVTLICSFVPVVGAAPMAFFFAIVSFFQGNTSGAIILVILGSFTGLIDNFLRPWLATFGESKTPAVVSFVFVIGGALMMGFPGLFIGLFVAAIAFDTLPIFWDEMPDFLFLQENSKEDNDISKT